MYLVLIETSGNQNFIFATNKLKENIGASELTYQAGTFWVIEAVAIQNQEVLFKDWRNSEKLRKMLQDQNPALETSQRKAEIIVAASGKALILTKTQDTAKEIITHVTRKALKEAPGLDVSGVYVPVENWGTTNALSQAIKQVHQQLEKEKVRLPSPQNRFLRLPIIASCAVSGLPASQLEEFSKEQKQASPDKKLKPISKVSYIKRQIAHQAIQRLQSIAKKHQLFEDINKLEKVFDSENMSWVAIVHADGNGLGQIFLNFQKYIGENKGDCEYIEKYREFSLALDECTEAAFRKALEVLPKDKDFLPIVPLIVGGDDLTVICHGKYALEFTKVFLQEFEEQTTNKDIISEIAKEAFGINRLSACAGVAIVKRHFPFSVAYHLAEQLIKSAKEVKQKVTKLGDKNTPFPCSAIDFHILYDTSGIDLNDLREKLEPELDTKLYNRPYIVSKIDNLKTADGYEWAKLHEWKILSERVEWLNNDESTSDNLKPVSSSQSHAIRTALFLGKDETKAQYGLIEQRYDLKKFAESETKDSLFYQSIAGDYITSFLDALDAKDFLKSAQDQMEETP